LAKTGKRVKTRNQQSASTISPTLILLVVVAAILVVGGLILLANQSIDVDMSQFPAKGEADAPVTFLEVSDYG
jgi:hypothetical protein